MYDFYYTLHYIKDSLTTPQICDFS